MNASRARRVGLRDDHWRGTRQVIPREAAGEGAWGVEECGCAPTPAEIRALRAGVSRRTLLGVGAAGMVAAIVGGPLLPAAFAAAIGQAGRGGR